MNKRPPQPRREPGGTNERVLSALMWLSLLLLALGLPAGYFAVAYSASASALQTKAEVRAEVISQLIGRSPQMWRFEELRLSELLVRAPVELEGERGLVTDAAGRTIVASQHLVAWPRMARQVDLFDAGSRVGHLQIQRSLRGEAMRTAMVALLGMVLASAVFTLLRRLQARNQRISNAMFDEQERARVTLHSIGDAVITTDAAERVEYLNPVAESLTQWALAQAQGQPLAVVCALVDEGTMEPLPSPVARALRDRQICPSSAKAVALLRRDGTTLAIEESAAPLLDHAGHLMGGVMVFRDVTSTRRMAQRITWAATHDPLTGLNNRREFEARVEAALASARSSKREHVVCYLDLDQFKIVNDTCGHAAGDALLRQLGIALQGRLRASDTLARLGGDEFGVLLEGCSLERAKLIGADLLAAVRDHRFLWEGKIFNVGASIGLVLVNSETGSRADVFSAADAACYAAKNQGRDRVCVYQSSDADMSLRRTEMGWAARLAGALEAERFELHYQPYLALGEHGAQGRHIEILLRLIDEEGRLVQPGSFLAAAERYNIMPAIDRWVISAVFRRYAGLCAELGAPLTCAVSLSSTTLDSEGLPEFIREQMEVHRLPRGAVCFEITETAAINNMHKVTQFMHAVKALGCSIALDDFGIGTSSLAHLKTLPVDYLKIDGSLVRNIANDPIDRAMAEAINRIGHIMGLQTVGEHAESASVIAGLRGLGVDFAQGDAVQRPRKLPDARSLPAGSSPASST